MALDLGIALLTAGDTYKVKVSDDDTTPKFLFDKVQSSDNSVIFSVVNNGADEVLNLIAVGGGGGVNLGSSDLSNSTASTRTFNRVDEDLSFIQRTPADNDDYTSKVSLSGNIFSYEFSSVNNFGGASYLSAADIFSSTIDTSGSGGFKISENGGNKRMWLYSNAAASQNILESNLYDLHIKTLISGKNILLEPSGTGVVSIDGREWQMDAAVLGDVCTIDASGNVVPLPASGGITGSGAADRIAIWDGVSSQTFSDSVRSDGDTVSFGGATLSATDTVVSKSSTDDTLSTSLLLTNNSNLEILRVNGASELIMKNTSGDNIFGMSNTSFNVYNGIPLQHHKAAGGILGSITEGLSAGGFWRFQSAAGVRMLFGPISASIALWDDDFNSGYRSGLGTAAFAFGYSQTEAEAANNTLLSFVANRGSSQEFSAFKNDGSFWISSTDGRGMYYGSKGTTMNVNAAVEINSTTQGFRHSGMTVAQSTAMGLGLSDKGIHVYIDDGATQEMRYWNGTVWVSY